MNATPPPEFLALGLDCAKFTRSDSRSWRGPCPFCGGSRRFVIFTDRPYPSWNYMCDQCGNRGFADQLCGGKAASRLSPEQLAEYNAKREAEDREREEYRRKVLAEFSNSELWAELHERMSLENREWWYKAGVPQDWQDFWQLGYTPSHKFKHNDEYYERPAYTIPKFDLGWKPVNIDYRLIDPPDKVGKYRPRFGLEPSCFLSRPDWDVFSREGRAYICEGSKKAMVLTIRGKLGDNQVVGVPSCNSWGGIVERVKAAKLDRVYVILDPGAETWTMNMVKEIGESAKAVVLPSKLDDGFLNYGLTSDLFQAICDRQARRFF